MRHFALRSLAAASLLLAACPLAAARRPNYGGTLRVEIGESRALEPAAWPMVFETLVDLDESGRVRPALAASWRRDASGKRWQFRLRPDVKFHDGSPLTAEAAAAELTGNGCAAEAAGEEVVVHCEAPTPLAEFADSRRAISVRAADGSLQGTGPFRLAQWDERHALLTANEEYWGSRPFLDSISFEMLRTARQRVLNLELARADLVELGPGDVRRAMQSSAALWQSAPVTLLALVFEPGHPAAEDARVREALALSIDRPAIVNVLLQKHGEIAGGLLPQWLSGYEMLFETARASQPVTAPALSLVVDTSDGLAKMVADRIAVDTRATGITVRVAAAGQADLRLVRAQVWPPAPAQAFSRLVASLGLPNPPQIPNPGSLEALYSTERAVIEEHRVIPICHLPNLWGATPRLKTWMTRGLERTGEWRWADLWLDASLP
jgi:peptide/nickel transport system substrate-binding protein